MIDKWLASIVINFILRQLDELAHDIDWAKLKVELDAKVRALVPGTMFDAFAVSIVNAILDRAQVVLAKKDQVEALLKLIAAKDWVGAFAVLRDLIIGGWLPEGSKVAVSANGKIIRYAESTEGKAAAFVRAA